MFCRIKTVCDIKCQKSKFKQFEEFVRNANALCRNFNMKKYLKITQILNRQQSSRKK